MNMNMRRIMAIVLAFAIVAGIGHKHAAGALRLLIAEAI